MSQSRRVFGLVLRRVAVVLGLLLLASYPAARLGLFEWPRAYDPLALPDLTQKPGFLTSWQMKLVDADAQNCALALSRAGLAASLKPDQMTPGGCSREGTLALTHLSTATLRGEDTRCAIAARLYLWERHNLQPAALRLLGEPVVEILHFGSYSCRPKRGGSSLSEHATANAFDIAGFRLKSGKLISVRKDWTGNGATTRFLHEAHAGLCADFNLTLSPDYNADHADHFHVDMGWWRGCR